MCKNKKLKWWQKVLIGIGSTIGGIIALLLVAVLTLNLGKYLIYSDYYSVRTLVCNNHGTNDNYASQGTAITDDGKYLITSGYMSDKTNSRIYITEIATNKTHFVKLNRVDGKKCTYHCGGVATEDNLIYIASNDAIYTINLDEALTADELNLNLLFEVSTQSSYVFTTDEYIYVGEFYDGAGYKTSNSLTYNNVSYNAMVEKYDRLNPTTPLEVIFVRNKVQGFAMTDKGAFVLSTSWGLADSKLYYYKAESKVNTNTTYLGVPCYVLETADYVLTAPAMSEELDYYNGNIYTNFESACNKYIFGKFFADADKIVAIDIEKLVK